MDPQQDTEQKSLPVIRTFKTDAEIFVKEKKVSPLQIAAKAYETHQAEALEATKSRVPKILIFGALAVILFGTGFYSVYFFFSRTNPRPVLQEPQPNTPFTRYDAQENISYNETNPSTLISAVKNAEERNLVGPKLVYVPIRTNRDSSGGTFISAKDFLGALNWQPTKGFTDVLDDRFNSLIYHGQSGSSLIVIFKVKDFQRALSSLFDWEKTVYLDWKPILSMENPEFQGTTTPQINPTFQDIVLKNNDARALRDKSEKTVLAYSIFNKQYVIISSSEEAISAVLERFQISPPS